MALSDDYGFKARRTGPKPFTEYSFGAIMVFVAQVGTALTAAGQLSIFIIFPFVFSIILPSAVWFPTVILAAPLVILAISLYEILLVYRLHTFGLTENNRIVPLNTIIILVEIILLISMSFIFSLFVILMVQTSAIILLLNFLSIYLMRKEDIQMEFRKSRNSA